MSTEITFPKPPEHAFEVRIVIGGEDWDYVLRTLTEITAAIEERCPEYGLSSGGGGGCHSVDIKRRDVTREQYRAELEAWMDERHRLKAQGGAR